MNAQGNKPGTAPSTPPPNPRPDTANQTNNDDTNDTPKTDNPNAESAAPELEPVRNIEEHPEDQSTG